MHPQPHSSFIVHHPSSSLIIIHLDIFSYILFWSTPSCFSLEPHCCLVFFCWHQLGLGKLTWPAVPAWCLGPKNLRTPRPLWTQHRAAPYWTVVSKAPAHPVPRHLASSPALPAPLPPLPGTSLLGWSKVNARAYTQQCRTPAVIPGFFPRVGRDRRMFGQEANLLTGLLVYLASCWAAEHPCFRRLNAVGNAGIHLCRQPLATQPLLADLGLLEGTGENQLDSAQFYGCELSTITFSYFFSVQKNCKPGGIWKPMKL